MSFADNRTYRYLNRRLAVRLVRLLDEFACRSVYGTQLADVAAAFPPKAAGTAGPVESAALGSRAGQSRR